MADPNSAMPDSNTPGGFESFDVIARGSDVPPELGGVLAPNGDPGSGEAFDPAKHEVIAKDPLTSRSVTELTNDPAFSPQAYFNQHADALTPQQVDKLAEVVAARENATTTVGQDLEALGRGGWEGLKGVFGSIWPVLKTLTKTGVAMSPGGAIKSPSGAATAATEMVASSESALQGNLDILRGAGEGQEDFLRRRVAPWFNRIVDPVGAAAREAEAQKTGKKITDLTVDQARERLFIHKGADELLQETRRGEGPISGEIKAAFEKEGLDVDVDPKAVEDLEWVTDFLNVAPGWRGYGAVTRGAATAPFKAASKSALRRGYEVAAEVVGRRLERVGDKLTQLAGTPGKISTRGAAAGAVVDLALGGGGLIGAATGGSTAKKVARAGGLATSALGRTLASGEIPGIVKAAADIPAGAARGFVEGMNPLAGPEAALYLGSAGLMAAGGNPEEAGQIVGNAAGFAGLGGGIAGAKNLAGRAVGTAVLAGFKANENKLPDLPTTDIGVDPALDASNAEQVEQIRKTNPQAANRYNFWRDIFRAAGVEMYVVDGATFRDRVSSLTGADPSVVGDALGYYDEGKRPAPGTAEEGGVEGAAPNPTRRVYLNGSLTAKGHELSHALVMLMPPDTRRRFETALDQAMGPEQYAAFGRHYDASLGVKPGEPGSISGDMKRIREEVGAEMLSLVIAGEDPRGLAPAPSQVALEWLGALGEKFGLWQPELGGKGSSPLGVQPSANAVAPVREFLRGVFLPVEGARAREAGTATPGLPPVLPAPVPPVIPPPAQPAPSAGPTAGPTPTPPPAPTPAPAAPPAQSVTPPPAPAAPNPVRPTTAGMFPAAPTVNVTAPGHAEAESVVATRPELKPAFDALTAAMGQGRAATAPVQIEYAGVKPGQQTAGLSPAQQRAVDQANAYVAESLGALPADVRAVVEKVTVPYRWIVRGQNVNVQAMSPDKVIANVRRIAERAKGAKASDLIPYPINSAGTVTDAGWRQLAADLVAYTTNQANGFGGDGTAITVPPGYKGFIGTPTPGFKPTAIPKPRADFLNLAMALPPPGTAKTPGGYAGKPVAEYPNVQAALLARANRRPVTAARTARPGANVYSKGGANEVIAETNPLRDAFAARGVDFTGRELFQVTEELNLDGITKVTPVPTSGFRAPWTDLIRGGFMPAPMPGNKVAAAAIRTEEGRVVTGIAHWDAYTKAQDAGIPIGNADEGFVDTAGNFLSREEAHALATGARQIEQPTLDAALREVYDAPKPPAWAGKRLEAESFQRARAFMPEPAGYRDSGLAFKSFFSDVTRGADKYRPKAPWKSILPLDDQNAFVEEYDKHTGNFDAHIATSIPAFKDVQVRVGNAVAKTAKGPVLDVGASEGSWLKAVVAESDGDIRGVALDPNPDMAEFFRTKSTVPGAEYVEDAFQRGFEDGGRVYSAHDPKTPYDVVHESMVFQFISPDRAGQVAEAKRLMAPDGLFLTEEKVLSEDPAVWKANEEKKDRDWKNKFYSDAELKAKQQVVRFSQDPTESKAVGMVDNMVTGPALESVLKSNFKHVVQYWDSGNFRGYAASDDPVRLGEFVKEVGDTSTEFSTAPTPRTVESGAFMPAPTRKYKEGDKVPTWSSAGMKVLGPDRPTPRTAFDARTDSGRIAESRGLQWTNDPGAGGGRSFDINLVDEDGIAVGGIGITVNEKSDATGRPIGYVESSFVDSPMRGLGLGEALYREAATELQKLGIDELNGMVIGFGAMAVRRKLFGDEPARLSRAYTRNKPDDSGPKTITEAITEMKGAAQSEWYSNRGFDVTSRVDPKTRFMPTPAAQAAKWDLSKHERVSGMKLREWTTGKPVVVEMFHGTKRPDQLRGSAGFDVRRLGETYRQTNDKLGWYFTNRKNTAADEAYTGRAGWGGIVPFLVRLDNPLVVAEDIVGRSEEFIDSLDQQRRDGGHDGILVAIDDQSGDSGARRLFQTNLRNEYDRVFPDFESVWKAASPTRKIQLEELDTMFSDAVSDGAPPPEPFLKWARSVAPGSFPDKLLKPPAVKGAVSREVWAVVPPDVAATQVKLDEPTVDSAGNPIPESERLTNRADIRFMPTMAELERQWARAAARKPARTRIDDVLAPKPGVAQLQGDRLPHAMAGNDVQLVRYSSRSGRTVASPQNFGKGVATPSDLRGTAKVYFYEAGSPTGQDRDVVATTGKTKYGARVSTARIYDASAGGDPLGYLSTPNREAADTALVDAGYAGVRVKSFDGRKVVALFEPVAQTQLGPVTRNEATAFIPRGSAPFMPRPKSRVDVALSKSLKGTKVAPELYDSVSALAAMDLESDEMGDYLAKIVDAVQKLPGMHVEGRTWQEKLPQLVDRIAKNIEFVYRQVPPELQAKWRVWYELAHSMADRWGGEFEHSADAVSAVNAALSPQKNWYENVTMTRRILEIVRDNPKWTEAHRDFTEVVMRNQEGATPASVEKGLRELYSIPTGRRLSALSPEHAAWLVRAQNELFGDTKIYDHNLELAPGFKDGGKLRWGSYVNVAAAMRILRDPTPKTISEEVGQAHKVRNFYNNHVDPNNRTDVTIDTHAGGVGILDMVSSAHPAILDILQGPGHGASGYTGTYPIYADAYRLAAERLGVLPREVQSVTWEAIRAQLPGEVKRSAKAWLPATVHAIHGAADAGRLDEDEARRLIWEAFGVAGRNKGKAVGASELLRTFIPDSDPGQYKLNLF